MIFFKHKKLILTLILALFVAGGVLGFFSSKFALAALTSDQRDLIRRISQSNNFSDIEPWWMEATATVLGTVLPSFRVAENAGEEYFWSLKLNLMNCKGDEVCEEAILNGSSFEGFKNRANREYEAGKGVNTVLMNVLGWIFWAVSAAFSTMVVLMVGVMIKIMNFPLNINNVDIVKTGWGVVRDISNNFFIVILLVIAVSTVLQVPNYHWRQLLPKLLIMAVLINFSKLFVGIMIDASQILMLTFAQPLSGITGNNIVLAALGLPKLFNFGKTIGADLSAGGVSGWDVVWAMIFALFIGVVALVVVSVISIILIYRMVMLLFLTILSPLPFLLSTFPKGKQYASQWWSEITKYLVVGPVMLFFLWISFTAMGGSGTGTYKNGEDRVIPLVGQVSGGASLTTTGDKETQLFNPDLAGGSDEIKLLSEMASVKGIINFLFVIGLMVGSLVMAQQFGVAGGAWAGKGLGLLQKMRKGAVGGPLRGIEAKWGLGRRVLGGVAQVSRLPIISKIPGLKGAASVASAAAVSVAGATAKREQTKISNRGAALRLDDKNEQELRGIANKGDRYASIAAVQALVKRGLMRDDDKANRDNNIELIKKAKKSLPPELASVFTDNAKKYTPSIAFEAIYKDKDKFKTDDFMSDVKTGKVKADEMIIGLNKDQVTLLNTELKGKGQHSLGKYLLNNVSEKDLGEMNGALIDEVRETVWTGIDKNTWERDEANKITEKDKKLREKFNKSTNFNSLENSFDFTVPSDAEGYRSFVISNREDIEKKRKKWTEESVKYAGDLWKVDKIKERGPEIEKAVSGFYKKVMEGLSSDQVKSSHPDYKKTRTAYKNGLMIGAYDDKTSERREIISDIMKGASTKDLDKMDNLHNIAIEIAADRERGVSNNALNGMAFTGENNRLYDKIKSLREGGGQSEEKREPISNLPPLDEVQGASRREEKK